MPMLFDETVDLRNIDPFTLFAVDRCELVSGSAE